MNRQEREFYRTFSEHGSGDAKVSISPKEVLVLLFITTTDLGIKTPKFNVFEYQKVAKKGFYYISRTDIDLLPELSEEDCLHWMEYCGVTNYRNISIAIIPVCISTKTVCTKNRIFTNILYIRSFNIISAMKFF